jgi:hypothetical protein
MVLKCLMKNASGAESHGEWWWTPVKEQSFGPMLIGTNISKQL